ncbi:MAG: disulfide bond formation protein B [Rickettsiaceae bacterium]|nr:disulfide bond formation protein B [Rickettsiaceae bacterium]
MSIKLSLIYKLLLIISIISLGFAYFVEYAMDLGPCPLCIYQRFPYLIFITSTIIAINNPKYQRKADTYILITIICSILLAGYHAAIEHEIFQLSKACKPLVSIADNVSVDDFQKILYSKQIAACDKPALVILNLSMTEWNLLLNLFLFTIFLYKKIKI